MKTEKINADPAVVAAARVVYLWHNGKQHVRIEHKMKALGFHSFHPNLLYKRRRKNGAAQSWPERFGWADQVTRARPKKRQKPAVVLPPDAFPKWLRTVFPEWTWCWPYQKYLYKKLARVTSGQCNRLMIFMPPRHGKSEMVTFRYTAWRLLREPGLNVIVGSYNQRLANKASRRIQRIHQDVRSRTTGEAASLTSLLSRSHRQPRAELWHYRSGKRAAEVR